MGGREKGKESRVRSRLREDTALELGIRIINEK